MVGLWLTLTPTGRGRLAFLGLTLFGSLLLSCRVESHLGFCGMVAWLLPLLTLPWVWLVVVGLPLLVLTTLGLVAPWSDWLWSG